MLGFQLSCLLVRYLAVTARTPSVALLYNPGNGNAEAWSGDTRGGAPHDVGTAPVNLQRGYAGPMARMVILVSEPPLVIDLGMAKLTDVASVVYFDGRRSVSYAPGNDAAPRGEYNDAGAGPLLPKEIQGWMERCREHLQRRDERGFATEFANVPAVDAWPQRIQDLIIGGLVEPADICPPSPPAQDGAALEGRGPEVDAFWMEVARSLAGIVHIGANKVGGRRHGHNIACVLVDLNNRVLAWGVNTVTNHPTRHAETKCIWMFQARFPGELVPEGATLYTTLQSCFMCSATIKHACGDNDVRVVYADADKVGGRSVLARKGGAVEVPLVTVLQDTRPDLLPGQLMLARSRWDRLRRAFRGRLDLPVEERPMAGRDEGGLADFMGNLRDRRPRDVVERDLRSLDAARLDQGPQNQLDAYRQQLMGQGVRGQDLGRQLGTERTRLHQLQTAPQRLALTTENDVILRLEADARNIPYTGGAPILLQNPVAVERLYGIPTIRRREGEVVSRDTRLRDLTTEIHGLDLLLQVVRRLSTYNQR